MSILVFLFFFFFQEENGIRDGYKVLEFRRFLFPSFFPFSFSNPVKKKKKKKPTTTRKKLNQPPNSSRRTAMYRSRSARSPNPREPDTRLAESDKIEGAGGWDALEWTKIDPVSRSVPIGVKQFLLEDEHVVVEGYGVVLVNTDDAGTLFVTNFRLLFLSEGSRDIIALGTVPLATIEKFQKIVGLLFFILKFIYATVILYRFPFVFF